MSIDTNGRKLPPMRFCKALPMIAGLALLPFSTAHAGAPAQDAAGTYVAQMLTPETALAAAQATLAYCRKAGWQVAVTVVDRSAVPLVVLRDRYAGFHALDASLGKARTAVSFRTPTGQLAERTQAGKPESGIRSLPGVVMVGGGLPVEVAGSFVGGIGVSGAPGGENDERCAEAGIKAIEDQLF
jgi:uncharacterized protein GlcG (DUF336 family)